MTGFGRFTEMSPVLEKAHQYARKSGAAHQELSRRLPQELLPMHLDVALIYTAFTNVETVVDVLIDTMREIRIATLVEAATLTCHRCSLGSNRRMRDTHEYGKTVEHECDEGHWHRCCAEGIVGRLMEIEA